MFLQIGCIIRCKVILIIFLGCIFLCCMYLNVSSNCLRQRMQSHTSRIYFDFSPPCVINPQIAHVIRCIVTLITFVGWIFLHCVFSNASSNYLHQRMQSHASCICSIFVHCVFSNASSNCLHQRMQSHTGCICLIFLHCVFRNKLASLQATLVRKLWITDSQQCIM